VTDVISFGPEEPEEPDGPARPRRLPWWAGRAGLIGVVAAVVAGLVFVSMDRRTDDGRPTGIATPTTTAPAAPTPAEPTGPACAPVGWGQQPSPLNPVAGLRIDDQPSGSLDRCDRTVADGPWTVVVRRPDGSFGRRGAVVTFPAEPSVGGRSVAVGGVTGSAQAGSVTWPVAGRHARVRGDLGEAELVAVAAATRVEAGRPVVVAPAGLVVVTAGPYRSPTVHEVRYGSDSVGEGTALGDGLTFTAVASGGGYEDRAYASTVRDGPPVHGRPALLSDLFGGSGGIAWEPAPGLVAFVGYSGSLFDDAAGAALHRLALRARPVTAEQWLDAGATVLDQTNEPR
jgi:hypothetical protein